MISSILFAALSITGLSSDPMASFYFGDDLVSSATMPGTELVLLKRADNIFGGRNEEVLRVHPNGTIEKNSTVITPFIGGLDISSGDFKGTGVDSGGGSLYSLEYNLVNKSNKLYLEGKVFITNDSILEHRIDRGANKELLAEHQINLRKITEEAYLLLKSKLEN